MPDFKSMVTDFLAQKRIAVTGVSRSKPGAANAIYAKLRGAGYTVFAVNPNAAEIEGDACYASVVTIPGGVDAVMIVNRPAITEQIVRDCAAAGVSRVWMHRSFDSGGSSVSESAVNYCREHQIQVITGGCPMMFCQPVDFGHKIIRWMMNISGNLPK